jgi:PKD repeat protein
VTIAIVSPTPGAAAGGIGGFSIDPATAAQTAIVVDITSTTHELVQMACPGFGVDERIVCRDGVFQGYWGQRSTKSTISGGYRLSILPPKGWSPNVLSKLAVAVDTTSAGGNVAPVASFTVSLVSNRTYSVVNASTDSDGTVVSWDWDWGDGSGHGSTATPGNHTYATDGSKTITLLVTDNLGATNSTTRTFTVAGWSVDATSGKGMPANATEVSNLLTQSGISATLEGLWPFGAPASGNVNDVSGNALNLSVGPGSNSTSYQQAVTSWSALAYKTTLNQAADLIGAITNTNANDHTLLLYAEVSSAAGASGGAITLCHMGDGFDISAAIEISTSNLLSFSNGTGSGRTAGVNNVTGSVRPYLLSSDAGISASMYTDQEKIVTAANGATGTEIKVGGNFTDTYYPGTTKYLWGILLNQALTTAQSKTLLQKLNWSIPWS